MVSIRDQEIVGSSDESEEEEEEDDEEDEEEDEDEEQDDDEEEEDEVSSDENDDDDDDESEMDDLSGSSSAIDTLKNKLKSKLKAFGMNKKETKANKLVAEEANENEFEKQAKSRKIKERKPTGRRRKLSIGHLFPAMRVDAKREEAKKLQSSNQLVKVNESKSKLSDRSRSNSTDDNSDSNQPSKEIKKSHSKSNSGTFSTAQMNKSHSKTDIIKSIFVSKKKLLSLHHY